MNPPSASPDAALCRLLCLFSSQWSFLLLSPNCTQPFTLSLQASRSAAVNSRSAWSMLPDLMSLMKTLLNLRSGLLVGLVPVASSPYRMSFEIRQSCMPEKSEHVWDVCSGKHVFVWDSILPCNAHDISKIVQVEDV